MTADEDRRVEYDRRLLDQLVRQHEKVHNDEDELRKIVDAGHWRQHDSEHQQWQSWIEAHLLAHEAEQKAVGVAIESEQRRLEAHREAHTAAHDAHEAVHQEGRKAHEAAHEADQRADTAALASMDKRLEAMNLFREQLRDQTATFVRSQEFQAFKDERRLALQTVDSDMDRRFDELRALIATEREERREQFGVKKGAADNRAAIYAGVGILGTLLGIFIVAMDLFSTQVVVPVP